MDFTPGHPPKHLPGCINHPTQTTGTKRIRDRMRVWGVNCVRRRAKCRWKIEVKNCQMTEGPNFGGRNFARPKPAGCRVTSLPKSNLCHYSGPTVHDPFTFRPIHNRQDAKNAKGSDSFFRTWRPWRFGGSILYAAIRGFNL